MFIIIFGLSANAMHKGLEAFEAGLKEIFQDILNLEPDIVNVSMPVEISRNHYRNEILIVIQTKDFSQYRRLVADAKTQANLNLKLQDWKKKFREIVGETAITVQIKELGKGFSI